MLLTALEHQANAVLAQLRQHSGRNILPGQHGRDVLSSRRALFPHPPAAQCSINGSCRLIQSLEGQWLAMNLARPCDWALLPALFQQAEPLHQWQEVIACCKTQPLDTLLERARLLGLALAAAPRQPKGSSTYFREHISNMPMHGPARATQTTPLLLDLSSLWAGPLCAQLLQQCGMQVIKIESSERPDASRSHDDLAMRDFYQQLNAGKTLVTLDFRSETGQQQLQHWIQQADIVLESARPRALQQLGIDAEAWVREHGKLWISITAYGRQPEHEQWVGYGDDVAASAGLLNWIDEQPHFVGDAIADPLTALHAALITWQYWQQQQAALLDINLHTVSAHCLHQVAHAAH